MTETFLEEITQRGGTSSPKADTYYSTDDSIEIIEGPNEAMTIEDSQPTEELFKHVADINEELKNRTQMNFNCTDCEEVTIR